MAANEGAPEELRPLLSRLRLPVDLTGRTVLDIGCGTGALCAEAVRRGASRAIGLDSDPAAIRTARALHDDPRIEFISRDWHWLPEGPFDVVLWVDSMHEEADPRSVIAAIPQRLAPDGILVLACGVHIAPEKQMKYGPHAGGALYPTMALLRDMLSDFAVRVTGRPEPPGGRLVEEWAFWCRPRRPTVLLVRGPGDHGKSSLADLLTPAATKVIALDRSVPELRYQDRPGDRLARFVAANCHPRNLSQFYRDIDAAGLTDDYVEAVLRLLAPSDRFVVIEGFMTDRQAELFLERLGDRAFVWDVQRR